MLLRRQEIIEISRARGQIIGLLNSDDFYEKDIFKNAANIFQEHTNVDVVIGQAVIVEQDDSGSAAIVEK